MAVTTDRDSNGSRDALDRAAATDPRTSSSSLLVLAGNRPDLRPEILNNPACSPELREWITRLEAATRASTASSASAASAGGRGGADPADLGEDSLAPFGWEPVDPGLDDEPFGSVLGDPLMGSPLFEVVPSWEEADGAVAKPGKAGRPTAPGGRGSAPAAQPPGRRPGQPPLPAPMVGYPEPAPAGPPAPARPAPARPAAPPAGWQQAAPRPQAVPPPGPAAHTAQSLGALMQQAGLPGATGPSLPPPPSPYQRPGAPLTAGQGPASQAQTATWIPDGAHGAPAQAPRRAPGAAPDNQGMRISPAALGIAIVILFGLIRSCAG